LHCAQAKGLLELIIFTGLVAQMGQNIETALTYDDVLIKPLASSLAPKDTLLNSKATRKLQVNIPILSSAMDTVTEKDLAIALAQEGGLGIIHKNMSASAQAAQVHAVKKFESGIIHDPITVNSSMTIEALLQLTKRHKISGVPVVEDNSLVGIITNRDVRFVKDLSQTVAQLMTPKERLITVKEGEKKAVVLELMHDHRIEKVLIVNEDFHLQGMITVKDILRAKEYPLASKDDQGSLCVGGAVSVGDESKARALALVEAGVDVLVVDTAHGHSEGVLDMVRFLKKQYPNKQVIAGNIATAKAAIDLVKAGADAVKVGVGPGSICTTRIIAGIGVPQFSAILEVAKALSGYDVAIIADGGIRYSGDVAKALAAGAHAVMIGSLFAGTAEAPGEEELYKGRAYKAYRGMGSVGAMGQGSADRYFQDSKSPTSKLVPEGIEGRVPYKGPVAAIIGQLLGGLRACLGYVGAKDIRVLQEKAEFVRITASGYREGHVHDVVITKEAPNYPMSGE
jgi:IMP dehydrogenase